MAEKYTDVPPANSDYNAVLDYYHAVETLDADDVTQAEKRETLQTLTRLWDNGFTMAAHHLGRAWRDGLGVLPDDEEAEFWFRQAADAGNRIAQYHLGKLYPQREVIPQDVAKAVEYLTAAAEQGHQYTQYALGKLYLSGDEISVNQEQVIYWLSQSATQGNQYAQFLLNHQNSNQPPSVLLSATRLLHHMSRVFQETPPPSNPAGQHVDSKLMRRIREKKIAMGHKPDDHEEHPQSQAISM